LDPHLFQTPRMDLSPKEAWSRLLSEARREFPDASVRTWLEPARPISLTDGSWSSPRRTSSPWSGTSRSTRAPRPARHFDLRRATGSGVPGAGRARHPAADGLLRSYREHGHPGHDQPQGDPLNDRYLFETFVIGKSNELAAAAAHAVAEAPGKTYNPLFIYGATGLGKTHLMQAIAHAVIARHPQTRVAYMGPSSSSTK